MNLRELENILRDTAQQQSAPLDTDALWQSVVPKKKRNRGLFYWLSVGMILLFGFVGFCLLSDPFGSAQGTFGSAQGTSQSTEETAGSTHGASSYAQSITDYVQGTSDTEDRSVKNKSEKEDTREVSSENKSESKNSTSDLSLSENSQMQTKDTRRGDAKSDDAKSDDAFFRKRNFKLIDFGVKESSYSNSIDSSPASSRERHQDASLRSESSEIVIEAGAYTPIGGSLLSDTQKSSSTEKMSLGEVSRVSASAFDDTDAALGFLKEKETLEKELLTLSLLPILELSFLDYGDRAVENTMLMEEVQLFMDRHQPRWELAFLMNGNIGQASVSAIDPTLETAHVVRYSEDLHTLTSWGTSFLLYRSISEQLHLFTGMGYSKDYSRSIHTVRSRVDEELENVVTDIIIGPSGSRNIYGTASGTRITTLHASRVIAAETIQIPLGLQWRLTHNKWQPYVQGHLSYAFALRHSGFAHFDNQSEYDLSVDADQYLQSGSLGWQGGVSLGVNYHIGTTSLIRFGAGYERDIYSKYTTASNIDEQRSRWQLQLGLHFKL